MSSGSKTKWNLLTKWLRSDKAGPKAELKNRKKAKSVTTAEERPQTKQTKVDFKADSMEDVSKAMKPNKSGDNDAANETTKLKFKQVTVWKDLNELDKKLEKETLGGTKERRDKKRRKAKPDDGKDTGTKQSTKTEKTKKGNKQKPGKKKRKLYDLDS